MLEEDPDERPIADVVNEDVILISGIVEKRGKSGFVRPCCDTPIQMLDSDRETDAGNMDIELKNVVTRDGPHHFSYQFAIVVGEPQIVAKVHIFFVSYFLTADSHNFHEILLIEKFGISTTVFEEVTR